jgi:hypothetical protein
MKGSIFTSINFWLSFSYFLIFLPIITGIFRFKGLSKFQKSVWILTLLTCLSDTFTLVLRLKSQNNLWVYHFYVPALVFIMTIAYIHILDKKWRKPLLLVFILFFIFSTINSIWLQKLTEFNTHAIVFAWVFFILLSLVYFRQLLSQPLHERLGVVPEFWFNTAVLLHSSGTLMLFLFVNYFLTTTHELMSFNWMVNTISTCILYISYSVTLWLKPL